jgi:F-type H+-transporting ATPase subunit epsilon
LDKGFNLEIVSPVKTVFKGEVYSVSIPGTLGSFQVLNNHAPMISTFEIGKIKVKSANEELEYSTSGGIFEVKKNNAIVLAESIESKEEVDLERARLAKIRAEEILKLEDVNKIDKEAAKQSLQKALNRINLVDRK